MKANKWIQISLGVAITIVCIWLALRQVALSQLTAALSGGRYIWLLPAVIAQLVAIVARSLRWVVLLDRKREWEASIWSQGIGYLFTNLFPFRLGELARVLAMSEECKIPVIQVAGTAVIERLLDVGTVIFALLLILPWMEVPALIFRSAEIFGALVLLGILAIILLARFKEFSARLVDRIGDWIKFVPKAVLMARWGELVQGLTLLLRPPVAGRAVALSLVTWLSSAILFFCSIRVFQPTGLFMEAVFMMVSLSLAVAVPSSPGFIGVFQFIGQQALVIPFGAKYSVSDALAITLVAYLIYYALSTLIGIIGLWRLGQSLSSMRALIARTATTE